MASAMPNVPVKTSCLICSHPVVAQDLDSAAALEWNRLIKTLCYHMQLDSKKVPEQCTTKNFPLCKLCSEQAFKLYESQRKIDEAQKIIKKTISTIERTVADAEILRESLQTGNNSVEGKKLRDKILEGYRAKLLIKAKLREQLILGNGEGIIYDMPTSSPTVLMHDPRIRRQFNAVRSGAPFPSTSQRINADANERVNVGSRVSSSPAEKDKNDKVQERQTESTSDSNNGSTEVSDSSTQETQVPLPPPVLPDRARTCRKSTSAVPAARVAPGSPPSRLVGKFNESSCTITISKVPCESTSPAAALDPSIVVKQEPGIPSPVPVSVQDGKRKRRSLFQGVEILKMCDPTTNKVYLQCAICRYPIPIGNPVNSDISPYQAMTQHITDRHLSKRRRAALQMAASARAALQMATSTRTAPQMPTSIRTAPQMPTSTRTAPQMPASTRVRTKTRRTQFTCKICFDLFPDLKTLGHHKRTSHTDEELTAREKRNAEMGMPSKSYYIPNLQCNICGRPIKGTQNNLEAHKFSHKNNEERAEAIKNNERGARNALVRQLGSKASTPSVAQEMPRRVRRVKKGRKGKAFPVALAMRKQKTEALTLKERPKSVNESFECRQCVRTFSRNCHFVLHMQWHSRKNKEVAVTLAAASGPPSGMDLQENETPVVVENGTPIVKENETQVVNENETQIVNENGTQVVKENGTQIVKENTQICEQEQPTSSPDEVSAEFSSEEIDNYLADTENPNGDEMEM